MRYVNPKDYGYVSQFIEAPLDYMNRALQDKQENFDKQQTELTEAQKEANLKGGYQTQELARKTAEAYKSKIADLSSKLSTGNIPGGINAITSLRNDFNNNPDVQTIRYDEQARALAEKQHLDPTFAESIQNYYDPKSGYVQRKSGEAFSPEWYKLYKPTDFVADHKDFYSYLKDNLRKTGETVGYDYREDADGNPIGWFQKNSNTFVRGITEQDVAPIAGKYASNPENAASHESAIYLNQKGLKESGLGLSQEEYANQLVKNYPGYHSAVETSETEKQLTKGKATIGKKGSGDKEEATVTNRLNTIMENTAAAESKSSTLTNKDMAGMLNGTPNKDGSIQVNMTDRPTYIKVLDGNVKNKEQAEENMHLTDFIGLKAEVENTKKQAEKEARDKIGIVFGEAPNDWNPFNDVMPRTTKTADGKYYIINLGQDNIALQDVNTPPGFRPTKRMTKDEFIEFETNNGMEVQKRRDANGKPLGKLAGLEDVAKQKGFDLNDPSLLKKAAKFTDDEVATNFVVTLQGLTGDRVLRPASDKNGFMDDEGNFITHNNMSITEAEGDELFGTNFWEPDNIDKLVEKGLVKRRVVKDGTGKDAEDVTVYDIPIFNKVNDNVADLSERVNSANYQAADGSQAEWFNKSIPKLREGSLETHAILKAKLQKDKAIKEYENSNPKEYNLNYALSLRDNLQNSIKNQINQGISKEEAQQTSNKIWNHYQTVIKPMPDNTPEQRKAKAKELFDLNLLINDPKTFYKLKGIANEDVGKATPQTTGSNPLGI